MCRLLCVTGLGQDLTHPAWSNAGQLGDLLGMDALIPEGQHELAAPGVQVRLGRDPKQAREVLLDRTQTTRAAARPWHWHIGGSGAGCGCLQPWLIHVRVVEVQPVLLGRRKQVPEMPTPRA